ncbi:MAG: hypothetical protein ACR2N3_16550 [Pyrinomonadaceae bacterium]
MSLVDFAKTLKSAKIVVVENVKATFIDEKNLPASGKKSNCPPEHDSRHKQANNFELCPRPRAYFTGGNRRARRLCGGQPFRQLLTICSSII